MQRDKDKLLAQRAAVIRFLYWFMILGMVFLGVRYVLPVLFPFVIAYLIAWALNRPITYLSSKCKIPRGVFSALLVIFFTLMATGLLTLLGAALGYWIKEGLLLLPEFFQKGVFVFLQSFFERIEAVADTFAPSVGSDLSTTIDGLFKLLNDGIVMACGRLVGALGGLLTGVPSVLMRTMITIIASIFIASDFDRVKNFLVRLLPESSKPILTEGGKFFGHTVPRCLLSYLTILLITFSEVWLGLSILGVQKAPFAAFFIAVLDIFPVLGTGTVLIPWAVISLFSGDYKRGISLLVLYGVITFIRQGIEPRLVGRQIKLHPVLTFAGMLVGVHFFGFVGLLGVPLFLAFLRQLHEAGVIHLSVLDTETVEKEKSETV